MSVSADLVALRPGTVVLGRVAAVVVVCSAVVHLLLLDATSLGSLVMLAMAAVCLPCAWHLWRGPTPRVWGLTAAMDGTMLVLHLQMLAGEHAMPGMAVDRLMWSGLGLVGVQLVLAAIACGPWRANNGRTAA